MYKLRTKFDVQQEHLTFFDVCQHPTTYLTIND